MHDADDILLERFETRLAKLAGCHAALCRAVLSGDIAEIRRWCDAASRRQHIVDNLRERWPKLLEHAPRTPQSLDRLRAIRDHYRHIAAGCRAYDAWLEERAPHVTAASALCAIADHLLKPAFDRVLGMVLIAGPSAFGTRLAETLRSRGQQVIVLFDETATAGKPSGNPPLVRTERELFNLMLAPGFPAIRDATVWCGGAASTRSEQLETAVRRNWMSLENHARTVETRGGLWVANVIDNLPRLAAHPSIAMLRGRFRDTPGIVVSPGPSLQKNVHLIEALFRKAAVIAINRSYRLLRQRGVVPDIVVTADPFDLSGHFGEEGIDEHTTAVFSVFTHPKVFALAKGPRCTFTAGAFDWLYDLLGEQATLPSCGSVASTAFQLAVFTGMNPIALVGQDLAFDGAAYYAADTPDAKERVTFVDGGTRWRAKGWVPVVEDHQPRVTGQAVEEPVYRVTGWHRDEVTTSLELLRYKEWFEAVAALAGRALVLYNCTEGGAWIEGFVHRPLAAFGETLEKSVDRRSSVDRALEMPVETVRERATRLRRFAAETVETLAACLETLRRLDVDADGSERLKDHVGDIARRMRRTPILGFVHPVTLRHLLSGVFDSDTCEELAAAVAELVRFAAPALEEMIARLAAAERALGLLCR